MTSLKKSVKINSPLPKDLAGECKKASKILNAFIDPIAAKGIDNVIPSDILSNAKGLAIFTVVKAGFLFSGRAGAGIVVARLEDGSWSAPSAIGTGGMGFGGQIGAEITDFVIVLNTRAAVKSFTKGGNVTLGGNLSVAAGPIGRNAEAAASASIGSIAAIYSYSKTKGLFAGVSIEGSIIMERKDANETFYRRPVTAAELLSGAIPPPPQADILYRALNTKASGAYTSYGHHDDPSFGQDMSRNPTRINRSASIATHNRYNNVNPNPHGMTRSATSARAYGNNNNSNIPVAFSSSSSSSSSSNTHNMYGADEKQRGFDNARASMDQDDDPVPGYTPMATTSVLNKSGTTPAFYGRPSTDSNSPFRPDIIQADYSNQQPIGNLLSKGPRVPPRIGAKPEFVVALYDFSGEQATDLSFKKGDRITVTKKTPSRDDWWTGRCNGREGIFPANYVE
ncbi:hypothetical protein BGZ54_000395 [Gamsiella multidivaricata]|nr:hypothetical protein BGZ54_000395 [Gamsiella multidivaricata]